MQANPVLAEFTRGNMVENIHRGAICVSDSSGKILASVGDIERPVFPRSAIKALQALAIFQSDAVEKFNLSDEDLALACASHMGEPGHVEGVRKVLAKIGAEVDDFECGTHPPTSPEARKVLRKAGENPSPLHNNCSGKHAGMLAVSAALGVPSKGYVTREHAVQKLVRKGVETVLGQSLSEDRCGTDGCSIPTWGAPLKAFASGFARMASGEGLTPELATASTRIFDAATSHPFLVRGTDMLDTDLMAAFAGRLMIKIGAEGVFCGALRDSNIGFALKIDDGNIMAAEVVVSRLLLAISNPNSAEREALEKRAIRHLENWRKIDVGYMAGTSIPNLEI